MVNTTVTAVPGVHAGHWTHASGTTGTTVLLFPGGARGGVASPGSATGSRDLGALQDGHLAQEVHGFCLSGGSAFGLAAADGVMDVLEARGIGFDAGVARVPIVPAAILFDLHTAVVRPDRASGRMAAESAGPAPLAEGRVGAAAGARVAKAAGEPVPGGLGSWAARVGPWTVGAVVAVNAVGSVRDPETGEWVAGGPPGEVEAVGDWRGQTTLAAVVTDAPLDRGRCTVLARMAVAGMARTLYPAFSPFDGDLILAASTGAGAPVDAVVLARLGHAAAACVARSVVRGVSRTPRGG